LSSPQWTWVVNFIEGARLRDRWKLEVAVQSYRSISATRESGYACNVLTEPIKQADMRREGANGATKQYKSILHCPADPPAASSAMLFRSRGVL
jgi:hypothetical protein